MGSYAIIVLVVALMIMGFIWKQTILFWVAGFASITLGIVLLANNQPVPGVPPLVTFSEWWVLGWVSIVVGIVCFVSGITVHYINKGEQWEEEQAEWSKQPRQLSEEEAYTQLLNRELAGPRQIARRKEYHKMIENMYPATKATKDE